MKFITRADMAETAASRWRDQYSGSQGVWYINKTNNSEEIYNKLMALLSPDPAQIDAIIGNDLWTRVECTNCWTKHDVCVQLDDEDSAARYCEKCLRGAVAIMKIARRIIDG